MPDYSLGRAHGRIDIDYDGSGAQRAARDLDSVAASSSSADKSLSKTQKTLVDTDRQFKTASSSADGYHQRLRDVEHASSAVERAEKNYHAALRDTHATLDDIKNAEERVADAKKRHTEAMLAAAAAQRLFANDSDVGTRASLAFANMVSKVAGSLSNLVGDLGDSAAATGSVAEKSNKLSQSLGLVAKAAMALGQPEIAAAAEGVAVGIDTITGAAAKAVDGIKALAGFEVEFAKITAITLGGTSLGGLAGLAGAAGLQGIIEMADAVKQLSGALGLLPGAISGVVFAAGTLQVAFHGVGDAITDMMADDPKKFLEDLKNMGPIAAQAMLGIVQFRDQFRLAGAQIQDSFFAQIAADIAPLIQTWLPAITDAMSQVAGIFGQAAHQLAALLQQPQAMAAFQRFVDDISLGLQALIPALDPLLRLFEQLTIAGTGFFEQIGTDLTQAFNTFADIVQKAASSGELQRWIQDGINAFERLGNILFNTGAAFGNIMDIAEQFGGGGLLGWLQELTAELANWTQSADGQQALAGFFTMLRKATDAFMPLLPPLLNGLSSLGAAFAQLGIATAPGWKVLLDTFAQVMANLGPHIAATAPAINTFLRGMATAFEKLIDTLGPQLPAIFQDLADAFMELVPQIQPLVHAFIVMAEGAIPELPGLFRAITAALVAFEPYWPLITDLIIIFVNALRILIEVGGTVLRWINDFVRLMGRVPEALKTAFSQVGDYLGKLFGGLARDAEQWGKNLLINLGKGITSAMSHVTDALGPVGDLIRDYLLTKSPAKLGPLHDVSPNQMGASIVRNFAAGIASAHPAVAAAAGQAAGAVAGALSGGAPAPGGRSTADGALLPDNIASADTSILTAYLNHQFSDTRGLKGLAKDLGDALKLVQGGFNLLTQQALTPMLQALGKVPGLNDRGWRKLTPKELATQQQSDLQKDSIAAQKKGPTWNDVLGPSWVSSGNGVGAPLGLSASSSKEDIQKAIIAAGKARGLNDAAIQTALAVAAAESGFNPTISGGVQGSAGLVSGLYQQSPSSGWGTLDQVNDPNYAINAFYDAFAKQLAANPTNPLLAAVLTQNPQLGSSAQGSSYWDAVSNQLGLANSIMGAYGKNVLGPTWKQITGSGAVDAGAPGTTNPYKEMYPATDGGVRANPQSRASTLGAIDISPDVLEKRGIAPLFQKSTPDAAGGKDIPDWAVQLGKLFNLSVTDHPDTTLHGGQAGAGNTINPMGSYAFDYSGSTADMDRFAKFIMNNLMSQTLQLIHRSPDGDYRIAGGQRVGPGTSAPGYYASDIAGHANHVHWATDAPPIMVGPDGKPLTGTTTPLGVGSAALGGGLTLASGKTIDQLTDKTAQNATVNEKLLQAYLDGNPELAQQIQAAQVPGAADSTVLDALGGITKTIDMLNTQDPVGNKNTIDMLRSTQNKLAQQQGFTQNQQGPVEAASSIAGSAANAVTSVFQAIQSGLDSMTATQDIADRLVYGVRNTEDISKIVDNVQKYITFAADIANATGQILSTIGSIMSVAEAAGSGPTGGDPASGAAQGLQAAGSIASLISGALQGVNAAIDFGQQIYEITMSYAGRFMSYLTGLGGTELMGNIGFLLNKNTGQLISYSMDNPQQKDVAQVPSWMRSWYDYTGAGNTNPGFSQLNIYAGPGQSPAEMMNETMWLVNTGGTTGALSAASF